MENLTIRLDNAIKLEIKKKIEDSKLWKLRGVKNLSDFFRYLAYQEIATWEE